MIGSSIANNSISLNLSQVELNRNSIESLAFFFANHLWSNSIVISLSFFFNYWIEQHMELKSDLKYGIGRALEILILLCLQISSSPLQPVPTVSLSAET